MRNVHGHLANISHNLGGRGNSDTGNGRSFSDIRFKKFLQDESSCSRRRMNEMIITQAQFQSICLKTFLRVCLSTKCL